MTNNEEVNEENLREKEEPQKDPNKIHNKNPREQNIKGYITMVLLFFSAWMLGDIIFQNKNFNLIVLVASIIIFLCAGIQFVWFDKYNNNFITALHALSDLLFVILIYKVSLESGLGKYLSFVILLFTGFVFFRKIMKLNIGTLS